LSILDAFALKSWRCVYPKSSSDAINANQYKDYMLYYEKQYPYKQGFLADLYCFNHIFHGLSETQ